MYTKTKHGFTMLELTMVIVILGIVASIGSSIIANIYEQYLVQRATHRASIKTELAAQQIAQLLRYRVAGTTLARNPSNLTQFLLVTEDTNASDTTHTLLEWIGADSDGFTTAVPPPWNGFCDVNASNQAGIKTPGSKLTLENTILANLSRNAAGVAEVSLTGADYPAIFFRDSRYQKNPTTGATLLYDNLRCMGITDGNTSCISSVGKTPPNDEDLSFQLGSARANKVIAEHYKLAWTAYAICPRQRPDGNFDLELFYNYQPWEGERLSGVNCNTTPGRRATIIKNVSVFKFAESGITFRFKLCAQENIGEDFNITICKEKAVLL